MPLFRHGIVRRARAHLTDIIIIIIIIIRAHLAGARRHEQDVEGEEARHEEEERHRVQEVALRALHHTKKQF